LIRPWASVKIHGKPIAIGNQLATGRELIVAKITDKQLTAKPGAADKWLSEVMVWGHGSLIARITPRGERLFYFRYLASNSERITLPIGTYGRDGLEGTMTLADARQRANELAGLHKAGIKDIREHLETEEAARIAARDAELAQLAAEKAAAEAEQARQAARKTVADLFEHWARVDLVNRKDKGAEVRRMFEKKVKRIYQRHSYAKEMAEAWRLLGEHLDMLTRLDAEKVISISRKQA
jgi:hypothetical protein